MAKQHFAIRRISLSALPTFLCVMQEDIIEADLTTPEGVSDAEAFLGRVLGGNLKPTENGETLLKLVCAAEGITHQAIDHFIARGQRNFTGFRL